MVVRRGLHVLVVLLLLLVLVMSGLLLLLLLLLLLRRRWRGQRLLQPGALRSAEYDSGGPDAGQHAHLIQVAVRVTHVRGRVVATAGQQARTVFNFGVH